jgi:pyridoxal phosphate enzyme (YggS family)
MLKVQLKEDICKIRQELKKDTSLIAVSKTRSIDEIKTVYDLGIRDFGENKVQELMSKVDNLSQDIRWHFIGHLQRNKVKYMPGRVFLIHSLDSIELLNEIEKQYSLKNLVAKVLIQINIGNEESKTGIKYEKLKGLLIACENCSNVEVSGLMATIPIGDEESCTVYFNKMKEIFDSLKNTKAKNIEMKYLSMGMSNDYKIAIKNGSNMIRVGEGIFGKRNYNNIQGED